MDTLPDSKGLGPITDDIQEWHLYMYINVCKDQHQDKLSSQFEPKEHQQSS